MQLIVQSLFFKALAFALLSSIWQLALIWLIVVVAFRILKLTASQKCNIAFAGQLTGFIFFIYSIIYYYKNATESILFKNIFFADKLHVYINASMPFISIVYLTILVYQFIKLFFNYNIAQRLRKNDLQKIPVINRIFIQQITALLSLKKKVNIYLSSAIQCPLTVGFFKPVILVPLAAINHLTKEQMEAVLLHEMAHIKRYDYVLNLVQSFIDKIFFFNVFSKMIHDIIEHERENACDDFVLQFRYNAFHYAEALLKLGRLQTASSLAMAASGKKENVLFFRIKRLLHPSFNQNFRFNSNLLVYSFTALIFSLPLIIFSYSNSNPGINTIAIKNNIAVPVVNKQEADVKVISMANNRTKFLSAIQKLKSIKKLLDKKETNKLQPDFTASNAEIPGYIVDVNQTLDSLQQTTYTDALNKNVILNNDTYKKALSYRNFKQLEAMLYASGKSITIKEDPASKDSYKKLITIEAADAQGNKNVYKVIVELYQ